MALATLAIETNSKRYHCYLAYKTEVTVYYSRECRGYMWNNSISKLFQPSSTSVWKNFISARGNLP